MVIGMGRGISWENSIVVQGSVPSWGILSSLRAPGIAKYNTLH